MNAERYFEIRKGIMLNFMTARDQYDELIEPGQGHLMFNGESIHWVIDGERRMSITINWAIQFWLNDRSIVENPALGSGPGAA
ncbi:hypothetical protein PV762_27265 [Mitsuaria sp. CC2]|uniref:hypothetical protein n=1 Tax=Mitsuaria sp. CC2 TaxID=3029186 RepID=UPI003B8BCE74